MSRLAAAIRSIEQGEPVDWQRIALLTDLDSVARSEQSVHDHIAVQREADDALASLLAESLGAEVPQLGQGSELRRDAAEA